MTSLSGSLRTCWLSLLFLGLNLVLLLVCYERLPDPVPSLWSDDGTVIDWISKPAGALLLPGAHLVITLFMVIAPAVDPGALRAPQTPRIYSLIAAILSGFLLLSTGFVFMAAMGSAISVPRAILAGIGLLLALTGNYLGKVPRNYIVGIRTPWSLSSDYVWERTHRLGALMFVAGGATLFVYCILQTGTLSTFIVSTTIIATLLAPCLYSLLVWRRCRIAEARHLAG